MQEVLSDSCQCQITTDSIDEELFACSEDSPIYVTYRARLSGTSERDSASLISLVKDWVATGPTVRVMGVLMMVDKNCPVAISEFGEDICSILPSESSTPTTIDSTDSSSYQSADTTAIMGGTTVVIIVLITAAIVIAIALIIRCHPRKYSTNQAEE